MGMGWEWVGNGLGMGKEGLTRVVWLVWLCGAIARGVTTRSRDPAHPISDMSPTPPPHPSHLQPAKPHPHSSPPPTNPIPTPAHHPLHPQSPPRAVLSHSTPHSTPHPTPLPTPKSAPPHTSRLNVGADVDDHSPNPAHSGRRHAAGGWYHFFQIDDITQIAHRWYYYCEQAPHPIPPPPDPTSTRPHLHQILA